MQCCNQLAKLVISINLCKTMQELNKKFYKIGDVSEILGIPESTLRYWETQFTIIKPRRNKKNIRYYTPHDIEIISQTINALISDIKSDFDQPKHGNKCYQPINDGMKEAEKDFITTDQLSLFTKFIYVLCQFLDGKNINILLSSLISKFQQIEAFNGDIRKLNLDIMDDGKIGYNSKKYSIFENSGQIADQLDMLRGVIKMDIKDLNAYETMIKDALRVIGVDENDIESIYQTHFKTQDKKDSVSGFFRNNIINSRRFRYIIKYINPSDAYSIIQNEHVRNYVLGRMNDAIIDRYAHSVGIEDKVHDKRKVLSDILSKVKFDNFTKLTYINPKDKNKGEKAKEREKPKAILGLYLTIVYLVVKSLVRINSQYVMAVYHLERDSRLCPGVSSNNLLSMTKHYCNRSNHLLKEKHIVKLERYKLERYKKTQKTICTAYRNAIAHLSAVRKGVKYIGDIQKTDSYFGIYHYCMQKLLYSEIYKKQTLILEFITTVCKNSFIQLTDSRLQNLCVPYSAMKRSLISSETAVIHRQYSVH